MFDRFRALVDNIWKPSVGTTFSVDEVVPAANPLWMSTLGESLVLRCGSSILAMPDRDAPALAAEGYFVPRVRRSAGSVSESSERQPEPLRRMQAIQKELNPSRVFNAPAQNELDPAEMLKLLSASPMLHPLIQAIHLAFSQHRPLVLSPDGIWLTIVQGFGHHVHENAEALRDRIVRHEGKKELHVETESLNEDQWPLLTAQFSSLIRDNSDAVLHETLMCEFSTTTPTIRTAMEVALMDVYQRYFDYMVICVCGIPEITLEGTPADWQRMRERIDVLATYDLAWWTDRLAPILDEFVKTANGLPDRKFWQAIYKPRSAYATQLATGWITDLFPYLGDPPKRRRNEMLGKPRQDWIFPNPEDGPSAFQSVQGVGLDSFPSGLSRAPVKLSMRGLQTEVDLIGGFSGVGQQTRNNALFPIISWAVTEKAQPQADGPASRGSRMPERPAAPS